MHKQNESGKRRKEQQVQLLLSHQYILWSRMLSRPPRTGSIFNVPRCFVDRVVYFLVDFWYGPDG